MRHLTIGMLLLTVLSAQAQEKVVVVGAGIAGLTAARDLAAAGLEVIVLEARDRIGGRIDTDDSMGVPLDLGASWILGIDNSVIYDTAVEAGVEVSAHTDWELFVNYDFDGTPMPISADEDYEFLSLVTMESRWHANHGTDKTMKYMLERMYRNGEFKGIIDNRREFEYLSHVYLELEYAGDVSLMSAQQAWEGEDYIGDDVIIPGGYSQIVDYLAEGLDIRLNHVVKWVEYSKEDVTIKTTDGQVFDADRAVITVPIGVLKAGDIKFDPPLPDNKRKAINELGSGTINKTWLKFPFAFWDTDQLIIGYVSQPKGIFSEWYSFDDLEHENILLGFNGGSRAIALESFTDEKITAEAMAVLRTMFGPLVPEPIEVIQTRWNEDPYSKGAYSFLAAGGDVGTTRRNLRKAVMDRLFFAGEATSVSHYATTTGAMETGARAAREIIDLQ